MIDNNGSIRAAADSAVDILTRQLRSEKRHRKILERTVQALQLEAAIRAETYARLPTWRRWLLEKLLP